MKKLLLSVLLLSNLMFYAQLDTPVTNNPTCNSQSVSMPVQFSWNAVSGAGQYQLEISTSSLNWSPNSGFPNSTSTSISIYNGNTTYTWNDANQSTTYYYTIRAIDNSGFDTSDYSPHCNFTTTNGSGGCSLPVPNGVTAITTNPYRIQLNWNNISGTDHYDIYENGTFLLSVNNNSYLHQNLLENSTHCYQISACCSVQCSNQSSQVCETTQSNTTYNISGITKKADGTYLGNCIVTFTGTSGSSNLQSVTSWGDGAYTRTNAPNGWQGNITAQKTGYTFQTIPVNVSGNTPGKHIIANPLGPQISIYPSSLNFPDTEINTNSAIKTITITNSGDQVLNVNINPPNEFIISGFSGGNISPNQSATINVIFRPNQVGDRTNFIQITSNATPSNVDVTVTGNGVNTQTCVFTDVQGQSTELINAVSYLCNNGMLLDDGDSDFDELINRAELAKLAYLGIGLNNTTAHVNYVPSPFYDLQDDTTWYYKSAKNLTYLEFTDHAAPFDKEFFNFYPAKHISKEYALKVLLETWNIDETNNTGSSTFTDDNGNDYIIKAKDLNIIIDDGSHLFHRNDNVLRGDIFIWLYRMMDTYGLPVPTVTQSDFYEAGNYTPENFASFNNMHSGNFSHHEETSFAIADIGIPLNFGFSYNSYAVTDMMKDLYPIKPLGYGWTHTYNTYVVETLKDNGNPSGLTAEIIFPNGEINVYDHLGLNQYEPITLNVYDNLEKVNGKYELRTLNHITYTYEKPTGTPSKFPYVLTSIKDRFNNTLTIEYELAEVGSFKRIHKVKGTNITRELLFEYYPNSDLLKKVTDPIGRFVEFEYDIISNSGKPNLTKYKNPLHKPTVYTYGTNLEEKNLLKSITLPRGNSITNTYVKKKLKSTQTNGNNPINFTYNLTPNYSANSATNHNDVTVIDNINTQQSKSFKFNNNGKPYDVNINSGFINSTIIYDPNHPLKPKTITVNGRVKQYEYFINGQTKKISLPESVVHQFTYTTAYNDLETYTDPKSNTYTYSYSNGALNNIVTPLGTTNFSVDTSNGLVNSITNAEGITTSFTYDDFGNVETVTLPESIVSSATYDNASRMQTSTNPNNKVTIYTVDDNDNLENTLFNSRNTHFDFDDNDNLTSITNARQKITTLEYFDDDLLKSVAFGGLKDEYTYFNDGKLETYKNPNANVFTNVYDTANNNLMAVNVSGENVTYTYWANTNNIKTVSNQNGTIQLFYDDLDRLTKTIDWETKTVEYQYDLNSNLKKMIYPGPLEVNYTYTTGNLLETVTDWNNNKTFYTYRDDGLLIKTENKDSNNNLLTYEDLDYDTAGRLITQSTKKADGTVINEYTYSDIDANGNHKTEIKTEPFTPSTAIAESIAYNYSDINRINNAGSINFTHDNNGNTKTKGTNTYNYDKRDNLTSVTGTLNASYKYDGMSTRRERTENGQTKKYVIDVLGLSKVLLETQGTNNTYYVYGLGLISRIDNGNNTHWYHYDYRGSTIALTDSNQNITHFYEYDDFGKVLQSTEADTNAYQYVGKYGVAYENDDLYFMRARYYDPSIGRFISEDPIWSTNLFPYADNNPVNGIDPKGEIVITATAAVFIGSAYVLSGSIATYHMLKANMYHYKSVQLQSVNKNKSDEYEKKARKNFNSASIGVIASGLPAATVHGSTANLFAEATHITVLVYEVDGVTGENGKKIFNKAKEKVKGFFTEVYNEIRKNILPFELLNH